MLDSFPDFRPSAREHSNSFQFWPWLGGLLIRLMIVWAFTLLLGVLAGVANITS